MVTHAIVNVVDIGQTRFLVVLDRFGAIAYQGPCASFIQLQMFLVSIQPAVHFGYVLFVFRIVHVNF